MSETQTAWRLGDHVHAAELGDDLVFLDLQRDAYLCLPNSARSVRLRSGSVVVDDAALALDLRSAGLIVPQASGDPRRGRTPPRRTRDLSRDAGRSNTAALDPAEWRALIVDAILTYRTQRLMGLIAAVAATGPAPGAALGSDMVASVTSLRVAICYLPWPGACLYRGFLLSRALRRRGVAAQWVFGVRTWPFHAHCWTQVGDQVVDDTLDRLRSYTPILTV